MGSIILYGMMFDRYCSDSPGCDDDAHSLRLLKIERVTEGSMVICNVPSHQRQNWNNSQPKCGIESSRPPSIAAKLELHVDYREATLCP